MVALIVVIIVAIIVLVTLARTIRIVPQARAGVVERFGRYSRTLTPGLAMVVPFVDRVRPFLNEAPCAPLVQKPEFTMLGRTYSIGYEPDLNDVLTSNFSKFGYAKAALLIQAHRLQAPAPLSSEIGKDKKRILAMALPALRDQVAVAYDALGDFDNFVVGDDRDRIAV